MVFSTYLCRYSRPRIFPFAYHWRLGRGCGTRCMDHGDLLAIIAFQRSEGLSRWAICSIQIPDLRGKKGSLHICTHIYYVYTDIFNTFHQLCGCSWSFLRTRSLGTYDRTACETVLSEMERRCPSTFALYSVWRRLCDEQDKVEKYAGLRTEGRLRAAHGACFARVSSAKGWVLGIAPRIYIQPATPPCTRKHMLT